MSSLFPNLSEKKPYISPNINVCFVKMQNCIAASVVVVKESEFNSEDSNNAENNQSKDKVESRHLT